MADGIYVALSGAVAQGEALDVVANNAANVSTNGFRAQKVTFGTALVNARNAAGGPSETAYVQISGLAESGKAGVVLQTANPLDLALQGDGFFAVDTAQGARYTRAGSFRISSQGELVDAQGNAARAQSGGHLTIPDGAKALEVLSDGTVVADGAEVGTLELVRFAPEAMQREGATLYAVLPNAKPVDGLPEVLSGALEGSNSSGIEQTMSLVKISRTYEALLTMIDSFKAIDSRIARELGGK